jgi:hypothetical protein
LRNFVDLETAEMLAQSSNCGRLHLMRREIGCSQMHCPQFVAGKRTPVPSDTHLGEDRLARTLEPNGNNDQQKNRRENHKEQGAGRDVERSLHISITPVEHQR